VQAKEEMATSNGDKHDAQCVNEVVQNSDILTIITTQTKQKKG
jgi:hypothetical protein